MVDEVKWDFIDDLVTGTPSGTTDDVDEGDDQLRGLKDVLTKQFTSLGQAAVTLTAAEINALPGDVSALDAAKISTDDYATNTTGGTVKMRVSGTDLFITNNGNDA